MRPAAFCPTSIYVYSTDGPVDATVEDYQLNGGSVGAVADGDPTAPSLDGWSDLGTVTLPASAAGLKVKYILATPPDGTNAPDEVCLLQQTSATAYDSAGNVSAATNAQGRVTATVYDCLGDDVADYQGQVVNSITSAGLYCDDQQPGNVRVGLHQPQSELQRDLRRLRLLGRRDRFRL